MCLIGLNPRLAPLAWLPVGYAAFLEMMGKMFDRPDGMMKLSVFDHLVLPGTVDQQWGWNVGMCVVGCLPAAVDIVSSARRQVT